MYIYTYQTVKRKRAKCKGKKSRQMLEVPWLRWCLFACTPPTGAFLSSDCNKSPEGETSDSLGGYKERITIQQLEF